MKDLHQILDASSDVDNPEEFVLLILHLYIRQKKAFWKTMTWEQRTVYVSNLSNLVDFTPTKRPDSTNSESRRKRTFVYNLKVGEKKIQSVKYDALPVLGSMQPDYLWFMKPLLTLKKILQHALSAQQLESRKWLASLKGYGKVWHVDAMLVWKSMNVYSSPCSDETVEQWKWTDNKKRSCVGKSVRRKNSAETDQEEKKELAGPLLERRLPLKDALEAMVNGRRVPGRSRYQMIDDIKIYGSYAETKRKAENWKYWRILGLHVSFAKDIVIIVFLTDGQLMCNGSSLGGNMEKWKTENCPVGREPSECLRMSIEQKRSEVHSAQPVDIR
ncbi:hypothetical protein ANN_08348 [Periplaneta americana]|uniref:Uncharacterized protein n=1 Tax=Periplaneta americana TaxID=6978 RepID=A0ABQ8T2B7_PERAM|nr:hypothetical protein ANN_08348 [Periplaneta americana]